MPAISRSGKTADRTPEGLSVRCRLRAASLDRWRLGGGMQRRPAVAENNPREWEPTAARMPVRLRRRELWPRNFLADDGIFSALGGDFPLSSSQCRPET